VTTPTSTYRLQISADFTLNDAAALVPYLADLGVGAVYISPILRATHGSVHGYDVVDHSEIDPDRGGAEGLAALGRACQEAGLGLVFDAVPNHMGVTAPIENPAWWDVLRNGQDSAHASWFDIDWKVADGRVLLPVLGDDADLDTDLKVVDDELHYFEHRFPIAPGTGEGSPVEVHDRQHYELVNYRRADTDQNYRRFFAVSGLAALRVEDQAVYEATHRTLLRAMGDTHATGIRIDHPDGLSNPAEYLTRLRNDVGDAWILVEKITHPGETLPPDWPVAGLTGYDALNDVCAVLVDPGAQETMTAVYRDLAGDEKTFAQHADEAKREAATTILAAEVSRIARLAPDVPEARSVLAELATAFPVYRSYLPHGRDHLDEAIMSLLDARPDLAEPLTALLPRLGDPHDELCIRFQQLSGAVMAKGVEDAAFYRYTRFLAFNEVGGDPGQFGSDLDGFHFKQRQRFDATPEAMTTLSTHDTKRGEDIRARLTVLAEVPQEWATLVTAAMSSSPVSDGPSAYLLWQTVVAVAVDALRSQPAEVDDTRRRRLHDYLEKAVREAGVATTWSAPDTAFEADVHRAVDAAFDDADLRSTITAFAARIAPFAWSNSHSAKLIQLTVPGVPDVYQGSELAEDSLVDPDNRRPVDFAARGEALAGLSGVPADPALAKLWITSRAVRARRDHPDLFTDYQAIYADGPARNHLVAFDRGGAITLATRLPVGLAELGGWGGTTVTLPVGTYRDVFTDRTWSGTCDLADVLSALPVALLIAEHA